MNSLPKSPSRLRQSQLAPQPFVPSPRVPASIDQRLKVANKGCVVCGRRPADPAHLVPQRLGGCAHPDCVIALCRTHHRLFDSGRLTLAPYIGRGVRRERRHALAHVSRSELRNALAGGGWPPPWSDQNNRRRSKR